MREEPGWHQGSAAPPYCNITLAVSQVLHAASSAAPEDVLSRPEFITLATDALLLSLPLTASIAPVHSNGYSKGHSDSAMVNEQYEQQLPAGCSQQHVQQLQTGLQLVCQAGSQLLQDCSQALQGQLATSLMLAALPIIPAAPPGTISTGPSFCAIHHHLPRAVICPR